MNQTIQTPLLRVRNLGAQHGMDALAVEEPLEIQLEYGQVGHRVRRPISVTMRTPGNDRELAVGFLLSEAVIRDVDEIEDILQPADDGHHAIPGSTEVLPPQPQRNTIFVKLNSDAPVRLSTIERNFYTSSSCGICGKASLLALRSVCPIRRRDATRVLASTLYALPSKLRSAQDAFDLTGGIHSAGLFDSEGELLSSFEDVGRHNAVDKLIGAEALSDSLRMNAGVLLLSGRASFELLQKSVMAGASIVASVGAPSSLAVQVARNFDVTLVGFLRDRQFNVYSGEHRIVGLHTTST